MEKNNEIKEGHRRLKVDSIKRKTGNLKRKNSQTFIVLKRYKQSFE